MSLSNEQTSRYERNILIPGIGTEGQHRLANARVAIVGLGGLGSSVGHYLAAAGIGTLGLIDSDVIELSNLQRQVLHNTARIGLPKVESAELTLSVLNPHIAYERRRVRVTRENAENLLHDFDVVVEASDNFETKFVLNDACVAMRKPLATAGILALSGQEMFIVPGQSPCLRCAIPEVPQGVPTTSQLGVLGAVPGILGSLEAMEVIRYLCGIWKPQPKGNGLLHRVDGETMHFRTLSIPRSTTCGCAPLWSNTHD